MGLVFRFVEAYMEDKTMLISGVMEALGSK